MAGGCTTVEIKSGYGFDTASELRLLETAKELGEQETVRIVPTLARAARACRRMRDREAFVSEATDKLIPEAARRKLATSVDAFCETIAFTPAEVERAFTAARAHGLGVRLHAEQLSNQKGAEIAAKYKALSADHLEHLDAAGAKAMARAGTVAVLLPGAFYALQETRKPPVQLAARCTACRSRSPPTAIRAPRRC